MNSPATVDFEERADQLSLSDINATLADGYIFKQARRKLLAKGAKFLVGPRGTGKTHLMRYTYSHAIDDPNAPLPLYANFSRYLHLEPLLKRSPDALKRFHAWVIAKLIISAFDLLADANKEEALLSAHGTPFDQVRLRGLVALLERGTGDREYEDFGRDITLDHVMRAIDVLRHAFRRERAILLLDDAALTLADEYLIEFFQIFRILKTETISPKASVYPGSTQLGPSFHASHEVERVPLWLSVEDPEYLAIMGDISGKRLGTDSVSADVTAMLKYVAFGIPRAYLRLLREYIESTDASRQRRMNAVVEQHADLVLTEFDSLALKLPQFKSVIGAGKQLFERAVVQLHEAQLGEQTRTRNFILGILKDSDRNPLAERMLMFLVEVGMLYPLATPVSHGPNRRYDRYIPHFAFLQQQGVFREGKGSSPKDISEYLDLPAAKHPLRRTIASLLSAEAFAALKLDLPPCQKCGTARINDSQLFCHKCGEQLVVASRFEACMSIPLEDVPGISAALIKRIHKDTLTRTIGHVYASPNASGDLQQANYIGPRRAKGIIERVTVVVNEFLS